jgi:protein ImuA
MSAFPSLSLSALPDIHADVWHADALSFAPGQVVSTGDVLLNAQLPGGGWPVGALTEILQEDGLHSEWRLLLPALARSGTGPVVLVGAPHIPFAPALASQGLPGQRLLWVSANSTAQRLWACEQALRCAEVDAVLLWLSGSRKDPVRSDSLRRLQMAAAGHHKLLFLMRPDSAHNDASPAVLRLRLSPQGTQQEPHSDASTQADALQVQLLKRRGPPLSKPLQLRARNSRMTLLLAAQATKSGHALDRTAARAR